MLESIVLGIIQGITEWLPVSSEGMISLIKMKFFGASSFESMIQLALALHLGTFFAALIYFWKDVVVLSKDLFAYKTANDENKKLLKFLIISTLISGIFGSIIIYFVSLAAAEFERSGKIITCAIAFLLFITALMQLKTKSKGLKVIDGLRVEDSIILGIAQGLSALPGLSRSGTTVSFLLLRGFDKAVALKLSFLMSLPIVFLGNVILGLRHFHFTVETILGILAAFIFGLLTIRIFFKIAEKINFGYFVILISLLTILSIFI